MSNCIAVASGKGGVGKSVIVANLSAALAQNGKRVIIVDADIGLRSQDTILGLEDRVVYDVIDVAKGECSADQAILQSDTVPGLHLLPAAQFERAKSLEPKQLTKIIRSLYRLYDYIMIDCPAGIERGLRNILKSDVDEFILVVTPDDISIRSAERALQVIHEKTEIRPRLIVNRLDAQLIRNGEMLSALTASQVLDLSLLGAIPEDPVIYRSVLKHNLFIHYDCEARSAVMRIASRLQGHNIPVFAYGTDKQSFFNRIFRKPLKEVTPIDNY